MKHIFDQISRKTSKLTTNAYSTSFSLGIKLFHRRFRNPIYSVYGFVRLADEIVDSFHDYDKAILLSRFKQDTYLAIEEGISLNPILHSFQIAVHQYGIERPLIDKFLKSMEMDLHKIQYDQSTFKDYIVGSAEVVGLMCLRIFCEGNHAMYEELKSPAMHLGSAFQKINFMRDLKDDYHVLGRSYFPNINLQHFNDETKKKIEEDILIDFASALPGIRKLPRDTRFGVYLAYVYFYNLYLKIKNESPSSVLRGRIRIPNSTKYKLLFTSYIKHQFLSI